VYKTTGHLPPTATLPGKLLCHPQDLIIVELILSSSILFTAGIYFPHILLHNPGYPKVCPDSLNLLNTGDSFTEVSSLFFLLSVFPTKDLIAMF
jgi:hypothetical protein